MTKHRLAAYLASLVACSCVYATSQVAQGEYFDAAIESALMRNVLENNASTLRPQSHFGSWPWDIVSKKKKQKFQSNNSDPKPPSCPASERERPRYGSLSGGVLYFLARQSGLDYTNRSQSVLTTGDFTDSSLVGPGFEWNPGFELSAGYGVEHSFWSFDLPFLYYRGEAHGHRSASENRGFFPVLSFAENVLPSDYVTFAKMHWDLSTAILDATATYREHCSQWFSLSPVIGFRDAWITQKVHANYTGATFNAGMDRVRLKSGFYGVGPLLGIIPKFMFGKVVSLYAEASASYLAGWFNVRQKETFLSMEGVKQNSDFFDWRWNGNFKAGLVFQKTFRGRMCGMRSLALDLGYDYLYFAQQYAFKHGKQFSLPGRAKALIFYGVHAALEAHF